jgi:hypothetical protein
MRGAIRTVGAAAAVALLLAVDYSRDKLAARARFDLCRCKGSTLGSVGSVVSRQGNQWTLYTTVLSFLFRKGPLRRPSFGGRCALGG